MIRGGQADGSGRASERLWVIVPAAGMGIRAGQSGVPKQFVRIGGKSVLELTLTAILDIPEVSGAVVPLPPGFEGYGGFLGSMGCAGRPVITLTGGSTRQESVRLALGKVPQDASWVAVHDAARPFVTNDLLHRVWVAAKEHGAAICGVVPSDTVKRLCEPRSQERASFVETTLDRDSLVCVQTPQVFHAGLLRDAHRMGAELGLLCTDDSGLVEAFGCEVAVVSGERANIKITNPEDFELAEAIFSASPSAKETSPYWATPPPYPVTGFGFDVHPLEPGRRCVLGGVDIPSDVGPEGHSDADVLLHAIMDGILGGLAKGDIGVWFPPSDPKYKDASSLDLMGELWRSLCGEAHVLHVDATVVAEAPKIAAHAGEMKRNIAEALQIEPHMVSIKATTAERLGALGRQEGIAAFAAVTLARLDAKYSMYPIGGTFNERQTK